MADQTRQDNGRGLCRSVREITGDVIGHDSIGATAGERALVAARRRVEASTALTAASGTARGAPPGGSAGGERAAIHTGSDRRAG